MLREHSSITDGDMLKHWSMCSDGENLAVITGGYSWLGVLAYLFPAVPYTFIGISFRTLFHTVVNARDRVNPKLYWEVVARCGRVQYHVLFCA